MTKAYMIMDLQYGSTGKGLLCGYLAKTEKPDVVVTAWGPNAGHTYIDENGREYIHRMLANGVVSPNLKYVLIGPGSVIDLQCLTDEIWACRDHLAKAVIVIHPHAVVVTKKHAEIEKRNVKIGSTMKGTGAAVIERIERDPDHNPTADAQIPFQWLDEMAQGGVTVAVNKGIYDEAIMGAKVIQIEGAQGYSLSMYHGFYPYTTSRDVTPAQVLADTGMPYSIRPEVYGTMRTYPIRVANRYDDSGNMIGTSGPCYNDQEELEWGSIGVEPELTTVTKLPRRIFSFSEEQTRDAVFRCAPTKVFLNFVNYMPNEEWVKLASRLMDVHCAVGWIGVGPTHDHVVPVTP